MGPFPSTFVFLTFKSAHVCILFRFLRIFTIFGRFWARHGRNIYENGRKTEKNREKTKKNEAVRFVFMSETNLTNVIFLWPKRAVRGKSFVGAVHFLGTSLCSFAPLNEAKVSLPFRGLFVISLALRFSENFRSERKKNIKKTKTKQKRM